MRAPFAITVEVGFAPLLTLQYKVQSMWSLLRQRKQNAFRSNSQIGGMLSRLQERVDVVMVAVAQVEFFPAVFVCCDC